jgi:predicted nucleic acid-binding protein
MKVMLDTNAYSDWRRFGLWEALILQAEEVIIPAIVLGELRVGFLRGNQANKNEAKLKAFLQSPVVRVCEVGEATSHYFASFKHELLGRGRGIPENDVWIAACCFEVGATLLTSDKHFEYLPQVRVARGAD